MTGIDHYDNVNEKVSEWSELRDNDIFLSHEFSVCEIKEAISKLNPRKVPVIL